MTVIKEITTQQIELRVQIKDNGDHKYQGICGSAFCFYPDDEHGLLITVAHLGGIFWSDSIFILTNFEVFDMEFGTDWIRATLPNKQDKPPVACLTRDGLQKYLALMPQSRFVKSFRNIVRRKTQGGRHAK